MGAETFPFRLLCLVIVVTASLSNEVDNSQTSHFCGQFSSTFKIRVKQGTICVDIHIQAPQKKMVHLDIQTVP